MALTPHFDRIVANVTAADIEKFLRSTAPEDDKQRVRDAKTDEIKMRLVGGYMIRTKQITPERLNAMLGKSKAGTKVPRVAKAAKQQVAAASSSVAG